MSEPRIWSRWSGSSHFTEWQSPIATHCFGRYETFRDERNDGILGSQKVQVVCDICKTLCKCPRDGICGCGAEYHYICNTGNVRAVISRFAALHTHRDALGAPVPMGKR